MPTSFRLPVHDLLRTPGKSRTVSLDAPLRGLSTPLGGVPDDRPLSVEGRLDALLSGVWFEGTVSGRYRLLCVRCLADVELDFDFPASELFAKGLELGADEGYPLVGHEIDLEPLVRDVVLLGVPAQPLCREACAGLCAHCGADQNDGVCGCRPDVGHAALSEFASRFQSESLS